MRLALITDEYLPNSPRVHAKMMHELALELARQGHKPFVITPEANGQTHLLEIDILDGIQILRYRSAPQRDTTKVKRAINETLLSFRAWRALSTYIKDNKIDGIIYYSPSIFFGPLVNKIKQEWSCPSYLILRDLFPQWVIDAGMIREEGIIAHYFRHFEKINYQAADHIGLMSQKNMDFFSAINPNIKKISVLHNWAKQDIAPSPSPNESIRKQMGLQNKVIFFYGGNIGHAQDMANLMRLTLAMREQHDAHFLYVGQGDEVELVQDFIRKHQLQNASYLPSISQDAFKKLLTEVDIGLFSLARSHKAHNFPGKLLGYMVNALPILGSVNPGNDLIDVINNADAGIALDNGEDNLLLEAAQKMLNDKQWRGHLGKNAQKLLAEKFSVESAARCIIQQFETLISSKEFKA